MSLNFFKKNCQAWISWGHVRYLLGDFKDAKEKYERCLLFPDLPSDQTHSIYIRLASIYLKEENVYYYFLPLRIYFYLISSILKLSMKIRNVYFCIHASIRLHACHGLVLEFVVIE